MPPHFFLLSALTNLLVPLLEQVDSDKYTSVKDQLVRLSRTYERSKEYAEDLEIANQALQFQAEALALQVEHAGASSSSPGASSGGKALPCSTSHPC